MRGYYFSQVVHLGNGTANGLYLAEVSENTVNFIYLYMCKKHHQQETDAALHL